MHGLRDAQAHLSLVSPEQTENEITIDLRMFVGHIEGHGTILSLNPAEDGLMIVQRTLVHRPLLGCAAPDVQGRAETDSPIETLNDLVEHRLVGGIDDGVMELPVGCLSATRIIPVHGQPELIERS